jgi:serine/threonine protein kinase
MTARTDAHPSDATLQGFARGELRDSAVEHLIEHLDNCPDCRNRAAALPDGTLDLRRAPGRSEPPRIAGAAPPTASPAAASPTLNPSPVSPRTQRPIDVPPELTENTGYEVVKELGRGGMGVVYLARNLLMDRLEVLKLMNKAQVGKPESIERFIQEIRSAARLNHPNVATAYSAHLVGEQLVLAMEYIEGDDLGKIVKARGPLPIPFACFCAREAALGLQRGHELGLVHRDIKPSNLILTKQGKRSFVKIVDFGLAKAKAETPSERGLTATNQMMGTLGFTAPEQLRDARSADTRADIYSLGCTLYCLLTGATPFQGNSAYEVFIAQEAGGVRPLREIRPEVPAEVAEIVAKMMSKDTNARYRQPAEVAAALLPFMQPTTKPSAGPENSPAPSIDDTMRLEGEAAADRKGAGITAKPIPPTLGTSTSELPKTESPSRRPDLRITRDKGRVSRPTMPGKRSRQIKRNLPSPIHLAGAVLLLAIFGAAAIFLFRENPPNGKVVFENVPPDCEIELEGPPVGWMRDGPVITASSVTAGTHHAKVRRGSQEVWSTDVTVGKGGDSLTVRVEVPPPPDPVRAVEVPKQLKQTPPPTSPARPLAEKQLRRDPPPQASRGDQLPPRPDGSRPPPPRGPDGFRPPPPPFEPGGPMDPRGPRPPPPDPRGPRPPPPPQGQGGPGQPPPRPQGPIPGQPGFPGQGGP